MKKCINGIEVKVLNSAAGYYIGTVDEDGFPNCRISSLYYPSQEDALRTFKSGVYPVRSNAEETLFCNSGRGCQIK